MKALMRPTNSPLLLDRYFLKSLHFELAPGFDRLLGTIPLKDIAVPEVEIGVMAIDRNPENPRNWRFEVSLEVRASGQGKFPYTVGINMAGYFTAVEEFPIERVERMVTTNGPSLLYSAAREILAIITGCSPYPKIVIPVVSFIQPVKGGQGKTQKLLSAASKEKPTKRRTITKKTAKKK